MSTKWCVGVPQCSACCSNLCLGVLVCYGWLHYGGALLFCQVMTCCKSAAIPFSSRCLPASQECCSPLVILVDKAGCCFIFPCLPYEYHFSLLLGLDITVEYPLLSKEHVLRSWVKFVLIVCLGLLRCDCICWVRSPESCMQAKLCLELLHIGVSHPLLSSCPQSSGSSSCATRFVLEACYQMFFCVTQVRARCIYAITAVAKDWLEDALMSNVFGVNEHTACARG